MHGEMDLYEKLINRQEKLALVGLGYVGMPIAVAFAKKLDEFINEHAAQGWNFEGIDHDVMRMSEWGHVIFSREEE